MRVSSSAIREAVAVGEVVGRQSCSAGRSRSAALSCPATGIGRGMVSRQRTSPIIRPGDSTDGVYAGRFRTLAGNFGAAVSIGTRPRSRQSTAASKRIYWIIQVTPSTGFSVRLKFCSGSVGQVKFESKAASSTKC